MHTHVDTRHSLAQFLCMLIRRNLARLISLSLLVGLVAIQPLSHGELTASLDPVTLQSAKPATPTTTIQPVKNISPNTQPKPDSTVEAVASNDPNKKVTLGEVSYETPLEPVFEIDIPTLLHLVEDNSLDLAIAKNRVVQSKWGLMESASHLLPSGSMYNYYERYRGSDIFIGATPFRTNRDTYQTKYMASYNIQLGGKDLFDLKASWHSLSRAKRMQQVAYKQAILDLLTQYNVYLRDIAAVHVAKETVRQAEVQYRLSQSRYRTGFTTKLDVTQAEILLTEKKGDLLRAENQKLATEAGLASMLKLDVGVRLKPLNQKLKPTQLIDSSLTLAKLLQTAVENRPDVKAMIDNINEAKSHYASTRAQLFPTVSVSGFKRRIGPQYQMQPSHEVFASISYDATRYMGLEVLSQMGQDKAKIKEAVLQKEKQFYDVQKELSETYLSNNFFKEQINIQEQKMKVAEESFRIARHRRMSGAGISLDVVQAEKDLADARQEYNTAVMNYNIAQLKLLFQTGLLSPQRILTSLAFTY